MIRIYVAASIKAASVAREAAAVLTQHGHHVVSTWQDRILADGPSDPTAPKHRSAIYELNKIELRECDVVVALTHVGAPSATYFELGFAAALGKRIIWVHDGDKGRNLGDADALVVRVQNFTGVLAALCEIPIPALAAEVPQ